MNANSFTLCLRNGMAPWPCHDGSHVPNFVQGVTADALETRELSIDMFLYVRKFYSGLPLNLNQVLHINNDVIDMLREHGYLISYRRSKDMKKKLLKRHGSHPFRYQRAS